MQSSANTYLFLKPILTANALATVRKLSIQTSSVDIPKSCNTTQRNVSVRKCYTYASTLYLLISDFIIMIFHWLCISNFRFKRILCSSHMRLQLSAAWSSSFLSASSLVSKPARRTANLKARVTATTAASMGWPAWSKHYLSLGKHDWILVQWQ